jgi:hypothetical protein
MSGVTNRGRSSSTGRTAAGATLMFGIPDGEIRLDVLIEHESVWPTQRQMAELFGRNRTVISRHIQKAFADDELSAESNMQRVHIAFSDKPLVLYSLDAVISVGFRVNSARGTQFRIWATRMLRDHLLRGCTLNERRLREKGFGEIDQESDGRWLAGVVERLDLWEARRFDARTDQTPHLADEARSRRGNPIACAR